jgi:hypothetical protein
VNRTIIGQLLQALGLAVEAQINATGNGAALDLNDYEGEAAVVLNVRNVSGTTPTYDCKLQDSDDGSTGWADIAGAAFTQHTSTTGAVQKLALKTDSCKRYVRAVDTLGGTSPVFQRSVTVLGIKKYPA